MAKGLFLMTTPSKRPKPTARKANRAESEPKEQFTPEASSTTAGDPVTKELEIIEEAASAAEPQPLRAAPKTGELPVVAAEAPEPVKYTPATLEMKPADDVNQKDEDD